MSRFQKASILGLFAGLFGIACLQTELGLQLEETVGLKWLFAVRGPIEAPSDAVVIGIDKKAAGRLGVLATLATPDKWPRSLHAQLIEQLVKAEVSVIAFDLAFFELRTSEEDAILERAIASAKRVVLLEHIVREHRPEDTSLDRLVSPFSQLSDAAMGLAPFTLPKGILHQFWTVKHTNEEIPGTSSQLRRQVPTLPSVVLQLFSLKVFDHLLALLNDAGIAESDYLPQDSTEIQNAEALRDLMNTLRWRFSRDPLIYDDLSSSLSELDEKDLTQHNRRVLNAILKLYSGEDSYYLNFYGPAGTIKIIPYDRVLATADSPGLEDELDLAGKAVFVGVSELSSPQQEDGFSTVFGQENGIDLTGVEIAATAFANLLDDRTLRYHLLLDLSVALLFGCLIGALAYLATVARAVLACVGVAVLYFALAQLLFKEYDLWIPLAIPLLFELPLALFLGLFAQYFEARRKGESLRRYVPEQVFELAGMKAGPATETVYGTCLSTDIEGYTQMARSMDSQELGSLMSRYYGSLFQPVNQHRGLVQDFAEGDNAMCVWTAAQPEKDLRFQACLAAIEIRKELDQFERKYANGNLPTRIGLHSGWGELGNVGPKERVAYRFIGEVPTTTLLIQRLNKLLSTRILASETAVGDLDSLLARYLGSFILVGNPEPVSIFELIGLADDTTEDDHDLCGRFQAAVKAFEAQRWLDGVEVCESILETYPRDGPSRFYLERCRQYCSDTPPHGEAPVIRISTK